MAKRSGVWEVRFERSMDVRGERGDVGFCTISIGYLICSHPSSREDKVSLTYSCIGYEPHHILLVSRDMPRNGEVVG